MLLNAVLPVVHVEDPNVKPPPQQYMLGPSTAYNPFLELGPCGDAPVAMYNKK